MPKVNTECPRQTLRPDGGKTGDGSAPSSLSRTGIRRALTGLPASRRCSPRQAESSASQQGRPAPCGHWISSEAFQLAWAGGCATGPQTRSRHDCVCGPRLDHLARGLPPLLAVRSPRATGLASSLSGCVWLTGQRCRLKHRRRCGRFSRVLPRPRVLPGADAGFVHLSVALTAGRLTTTARAARPVLIHGSNRIPSG